MDRDPKHLQEMVRRAEKHQGSAFVEIYQNCNVFNDGAFFLFTEKETRDDHVVYLEHGKPLVFGKSKEKGIRLNGFTPEVVTLTGREVLRERSPRAQREGLDAGVHPREHDPQSRTSPRAMGVFLAIDRPTYEEQMADQIAQAKSKKGQGDLQKLLDGDETWVIT